MTDLFDTVISNVAAERPSFRQAPAGDYLAIVQSVKAVKANSGTQGIELTFTLREVVSDTDMTDVDLSKVRCRDTQWISDKALPFVQERLARITDEVVGISFREALDVLPGNEVILSVSHETENRDGTKLNTPRLKVDRYYSVNWYMENKRKAA